MNRDDRNLPQTGTPFIFIFIPEEIFPFQFSELIHMGEMYM